MIIHKNKVYEYIFPEMAEFLISKSTFKVWFNNYEKWHQVTKETIADDIAMQKSKPSTFTGVFIMEVGKIDAVNIGFNIEKGRQEEWKTFKIDSMYKSNFEFWENKD